MRDAEPFRTILGRFRLDGRTALVTGGTGAIGGVLARGLAQAGADIVLVARGRERLESFARELSAVTGRRVETIAGDLGRAEDVDRIVASALSSGRIDVLVNNAFMGSVSDDAVGDDAAWDGPWRVNVLAPLRLVNGLAPAMQTSGGSVINILSTAAFVPVAERKIMPYGVTKAALAMATRYLALQLAPRVRVNAICPGTTSADGTFEASGKPASVTDMWARLLESVPLARLGSAEETAAAAVYLASDASGYTTGDTMFVDGGRVGVGVGWR